jgi:hypothetical protein
VRFDREERDGEDAGREREPAVAPADPHALLALQRSAGNVAVGRMIQRKFYAESGGGTYTWHPEALDPGQWEDTGKTTRWLLWNYPVYRPRQKAPEGGGDDAEKTKRRRRRKRKAPAAVQQETATTELVEADDEAVEDETETAGPEESPPQVMQPEDDGGWTDVRSRGAVRAEREMARDVDALAVIIDGHAGEAAEIGATFNQLFNARVRQGLEVEGTITSSYTTRFDRGRGGYSVEVTIPGLANWVIHAHLDSTGALAPGENAIHYKRGAERFTLGVSIALTPRQIGGLMPDEATCAGWHTTQRRGNL